MSDSVGPYRRQPARLLCPWDSQARILEWVAIPTPGDLLNPGVEPAYPAWLVGSLPQSHREAGSKKLEVSISVNQKLVSILRN